MIDEVKEDIRKIKDDIVDIQAFDERVSSISHGTLGMERELNKRGFLFLSIFFPSFFLLLS